MPLVNVIGMPRLTQTELQELETAVKWGVSNIRELRVDPQMVTVCIVADQLTPYRETFDDIIVQVVGLFVKPERTLEVKLAMCRNLITEVEDVIQKNRNLKPTVEVFNSSHDETVDACVDNRF